MDAAAPDACVDTVDGVEARGSSREGAAPSPLVPSGWGTKPGCMEGRPAKKSSKRPPASCPLPNARWRNRVVSATAKPVPLRKTPPQQHRQRDGTGRDETRRECVRGHVGFPTKANHNKRKKELTNGLNSSVPQSTASITHTHTLTLTFVQCMCVVTAQQQSHWRGWEQSRQQSR